VAERWAALREIGQAMTKGSVRAILGGIDAVAGGGKDSDPAQYKFVFRGAEEEGRIAGPGRLFTVQDLAGKRRRLADLRWAVQSDRRPADRYSGRRVGLPTLEYHADGPSHELHSGPLRKWGARPAHGDGGGGLLGLHWKKETMAKCW